MWKFCQKRNHAIRFQLGFGVYVKWPLHKHFFSVCQYKAEEKTKLGLGGLPRDFFFNFEFLYMHF